jgi:spermidine synthase
MALYHGTTLHGLQALDPARRHESLTYYHRTGPVGQVFGELPQTSATSQVAVIGLGVGTLATYAGPNQHWTFYEIDPAIERIARSPKYFTYLEGCADRCRVVVGDARLSLARLPPTSQFGVIVLDAFSSDSIPMHLMTSEAFSLYLNHLAPHGVVAAHISNRHLTLGPTVARLAMAHGMTALQRTNWIGGDVQPDGETSSVWVVMARSADDLGPLSQDSRWVHLNPPRATPLWTDNFSNILGVVSFLK